MVNSDRTDVARARRSLSALPDFGTAWFRRQSADVLHAHSASFVSLRTRTCPSPMGQPQSAYSAGRPSIASRSIITGYRSRSQANRDYIATLVVTLLYAEIKKEKALSRVRTLTVARDDDETLPAYIRSNFL